MHLLWIWSHAITRVPAAPLWDLSDSFSTASKTTIYMIAIASFTSMFLTTIQLTFRTPTFLLIVFTGVVTLAVQMATLSTNTPLEIWHQSTLKFMNKQTLVYGGPRGKMHTSNQKASCFMWSCQAFLRVTNMDKRAKLDPGKSSIYYYYYYEKGHCMLLIVHNVARTSHIGWYLFHTRNIHKLMIRNIQYWMIFTAAVIKKLTSRFRSTIVERCMLSKKTNWKWSQDYSVYGMVRYGTQQRSQSFDNRWEHFVLLRTGDLNRTIILRNETRNSSSSATVTFCSSRSLCLLQKLVDPDSWTI